MAYKSFKMGNGLQLKADSTSIPDDGLQQCRHSSFDTVGALTSARGRQKANNGAVLAGTGSILGGFDGIIDDAKERFLKQADEVYYGTVAAGANLTATYATEVGALAPPFLGGTPPTWSATGRLTGFCYNGYAYMADGTGLGRWNATETEMQTWGMRSPGYHELTGTDPISTTAGDATVTVTVAGGHGLGAGTGLSYPFSLNIELVGMESVGAIPENQINCLHSGYESSTDGDVLVTTDGGLMSDGATYTVTFQGQYAAVNMPKLDIRSPSGGEAGLSGGNLDVNTTTDGAAPTTNEVQTLAYTGTVTSGYLRLYFAQPNSMGGASEVTANLPYNCSAADVKAALEALTLINGGSAATSQCSVTSDTVFTFEIPDGTNVTTDTGGGSIGFMRAGPTVVEGTADGGLVAGKYYYAYTFYNGVAESNFSAQVPIDISYNGSVNLSNIMIGPAGTTERRIYRTDVNGRQLYYIGKIADNTTKVYTDLAGLAQGADPDAVPGDAVTDLERKSNVADDLTSPRRASRRSILEAEATARAAEKKKREKLSTNLGLLSDWTDHDPAPLDLRHVGMVGETAVGISGNDIVFSDAGNPEHWPLSNRVRPAKNNSASLKAWAQFDRDIIIYTDSSLHRLTAIGLDFSDSRLEEIESPVGLAGEYALASLDGQAGHIFLTTAGLYLFDGARVNEISFPIEPMFTDPTHEDYINPAYMSQAEMVMSRDRMWLAYATTSGDNNRLLFVDFQDISSPKYSVYEWEGVTLWREKADNTVLLGDSTGQVYVLDSGWSDAGAATAWEWETKEWAFNGGSLFNVDELVVDANFAGATTSLVVKTRGKGVTKTATFSTTATGRQRLKFKCPTYLRGEVVSVTGSSSSTAKRQLFEVGFTGLPGDEV